LCTEKGAAEAHYTLDNLPNKILAAEYQTILPDEKIIAENWNAPAGNWSNGASQPVEIDASPNGPSASYSCARMV
jgi:hypothetical protein